MSTFRGFTVGNPTNMATASMLFKRESLCPSTVRRGAEYRRCPSIPRFCRADWVEFFLFCLVNFGKIARKCLSELFSNCFLRIFQRTPKRGGGKTSRGDPPRKTVSDPPHLSTFCPPPPSPFLLVSPLEVPRISLS